jgi:pimeloyl-ACP methyl ester carboxylesterase
VRSEPETHYVKSGDAHIAYQVVGDAPVDLIVVRGYISHLEVAWESPALASFYRQLASFCRLILFDKRGTGLSDRVPEDRLPTLEQRMDDMRAVMEAVGSDRAALLGASEGGPMCLLFAATYPERTLGLLLWGCFARYDWRRSFIGRYWGGETVDAALDRLEREWGDGGDLVAMAPSLADDDVARRAWGRAQRLAATPTAARALLRMMLDVDVRPLLPAIRVPVVILHRVDELAVDVSHSRYMAEHIPHARYVELPGSDHLPWIGDTEPIVAEIQELVTGTRPEPEPDRVVATVMFVDAPAKANLAEVVGSHVARFRGEMLEGLGASFDGPARAIRCAEAIVADGDRCRAGLHTGECELRDGELRGVAVDTAREILARASPGEVLVSRTVADLVAGAGIGFVDRGNHALAAVRDSWQLLATTTGRAPPAHAAMQFRREGDYWTIAFGGKVVRMRDAKGLGYLARLLRHPHREFHVLDLLAGEARRVSPAPAGGALLDESAKRAYRERIAELEAEIEQARRWNDAERAASIEGELGALTHELAGALGLGGRDRRAASEGERARASVTKAVRSTMRRLDDQHPELGRHLSVAVHTGIFCAYDPDSGVPADWDT